MSALTLTLREPPAQRVDMSPLIPRELAGRKLAEIAAIELACGNRMRRVDELFDLSGGPLTDPAGEIEIAGGSGLLDRIGAGMTQGAITVAGDAGAYLGLMMTGGTLRVSGAAGPFAACALAGGEVHIGGDAGDFLGGALAGERVGMRGGLVAVGGNAGARAGDHLRRGTLLIAGSTGPYCGSRMIAGSIVVLGETGPNVGFSMRRGTILLARRPERLLATFNDCGHHDLPFLWLLYDQAKAHGAAFAGLEDVGERVRRFAGDRGVDGQGEILWPE